MTTDTSEKGLETLIIRHMTGCDGLGLDPGAVSEKPNAVGTGYFAGCPKDFDRALALDVPQLFAFLHATQPREFQKLGIANPSDPKDINRLKFLSRLSSSIGKDGVIEVLRRGLDYGPAHFTLFFQTPSEGNAKAAALHAQNRFSITRQLAYSRDETRRALDLCLFINGLPIATFELKNSLTKQTVEDAVEQYRRDRDPRESSSSSAAARFTSRSMTARCACVPSSKVKPPGSCLSTRAITTARATLRTRMVSRPIISGRSIYPCQTNGNYWRTTPRSSRRKTIAAGRRKRRQVWPRYHQLDVVRKSLADVCAKGAGKRYLIQHSAGSGKSNSIAWLSHQLIGLRRRRQGNLRLGHRGDRPAYSG